MSLPKTVLGGDDVHAMVVDCGSWVIRLGCAGDDSPRSFLPCAVGIRATPPPSVAAADSNDVVMKEVDTPAAETPRPPALATVTDGLPSRPSSGLVGNLVLTSPGSLRDIHPVYTQDLETGDAKVRSWDAMEAVWQSSFKALSLAPSESPLMIVEPTRMWADSDRASALQLAFESLQVPAAYIGRGSAMAAFASARTTACVLDVGAQGATAVPVIDGFALHKTTKRGVVGGAFLTQKLQEWAERCLESRPDYSGNHRGVGKRMRGDHDLKDEFLRADHELKRERVLGSTDDVRKYVVTDLSSDKFAEGHRQFYRLRVVDDMKSALMQIDGGKATDNGGGKDGGAKGSQQISATTKGKPKGQPQSGEGSGKSDEKDEKDNSDKNKVKDKSTSGSGKEGHVLPDGNVLSLDENGGNEIAEYLFTSRPDSDMQSLTDLVFNCISASDVDQRRDLYGGVVVTGGTTMIGGVVERLSRELALAIPQAYKLRLHSAPNAVERNCGPWIGGSIVASLGTFQQAWVSKAEYDELGAHGALRKCP